MNPRSATLSEAASKEILSGFGVPFAREQVVHTADEAADAASAIGFPVVVKLGGDAIAHKTERGLVRLRLGDAGQVRSAAAELLAKATPADGPVHLLVAEMVTGSRELIAGLLVDPQFGPTVMLGIGGILAEAIADVTFRPAPVSEQQALDMVDSLRMQGILGRFRGEEAVDRASVARCLAG
ncbi:MAG: acetate--CoA ligase family protein, partial [Actinomycetota bacterium]